MSEKRNITFCPKCEQKGTPLNSNEWDYVCLNSKCDFKQWDVNEDFNCVKCGKRVYGRYLFCSDECSNKGESEGNDETKA